jgi:hypothetical protein
MTQRRFEKVALQLLSSILLSVTMWTIVNNFIINIGFGKYLIIELLLLFLFRIYIFVHQRIDGIEE